MRKLSVAVKTILSLEEISYVYLVKIEYKTGTVYETTASSPISVNGETYQPTESLYTIDAARLSSVVDREAYKLVYVDPNFEKRASFESGLVNTKMTTMLCFVNTTGDWLGGYKPGEYMTNVEDLIVAYSGRIDTHGYAMDPDEGTILAVIEGASPMSSLGLSRPFVTSKEYMKRLNPADTSFDQVYVGSKRVGYAWGKQ